MVTGASRGIGRACAEIFCAAGDHVIGTARSVVPCGFSMLPMDVTDANSVQACVQQIISTYGRIDVLVHCAGAGLGGALEDFSDAQLSFEAELNLVGAARVMQAVLPHMRAQKGGVILCVGSVAARIPIPYQSLYSASKAGLAAMVSALRPEVSPFGIRVAVLEPGDTCTGFTGARAYAEGIAHNPAYRVPCEHALNTMMYDERHGKSPNTVARVALKAAGKKRLPARIVICADYKLLAGLARVLPGWLVEALVKKIYLQKGKDGGFSYPPQQ